MTAAATQRLPRGGPREVLGFVSLYPTYLLLSQRLGDLPCKEFIRPFPGIINRGITQRTRSETLNIVFKNVPTDDLALLN